MIAVRGPGPCLTSVGVNTTESASASCGRTDKSDVEKFTCPGSYSFKTSLTARNARCDFSDTALV